jgi:hypothetical protein
MPKKQKSYEAIVPLDSNSLKRIIKPGEVIELSEEDAKILLAAGAITEVKNGSDTEFIKLG